MNSPIGIFDSGLGGLSVAAEVLRDLPNEQIVYFADNAHVPYGERPLEEIRRFALSITDFLVDMGAKAIVMACNMSSATALDEARHWYPDLQILGVIEPGVAEAVGVAQGRPIGVLATTGTVNSGAYPNAIARLDSNVRVLQMPCPRFVPLVEAGKSDGEEAGAAAREYVGPLVAQGCRTLILGCTHYPFVRGSIEAAAGERVKIVDPAQETVRLLHKRLVEGRLVSEGTGAPHEFFASGETRDFAATGSAFLGSRIEFVKPVRWGIDLGRVRTDAAV